MLLTLTAYWPFTLDRRRKFEKNLFHFYLLQFFILNEKEYNIYFFFQKYSIIEFVSKAEILEIEITYSFLNFIFVELVTDCGIYLY